MGGEEKAIILCIVVALWFTYHRHIFNDIEEDQTPECKDKVEVSIRQLPYYEYDDILYSKKVNKVILSYDTYLSWDCQGKVDKLNMKMNGKTLETRVKGNSIVSSNLRIIKRTELICIDTETKCTVKVIVSLIPGAGIISSNRLVNDDDYVIQYGDETIGVVCMGEETSKLVLRKEKMRLLTDETSMKPTADVVISYFEEPELRVTEYVCTDESNGLSKKITIRVVPKIYVHSKGKLIEPLYGYGRDSKTEVYQVSYGDDIKVFCEWPRQVNFVAVGNEDLVAETVGFFPNTLRIQRIITEESMFGCADKDSDYIRKVRIDVDPQTVKTHGDEL